MPSLGHLACTFSLFSLTIGLAEGGLLLPVQVFIVQCLNIPNKSRFWVVVALGSPNSFFSLG